MHPEDEQWFMHTLQQDEDAQLLVQYMREAHIIFDVLINVLTPGGGNRWVKCMRHVVDFIVQ
jgi:hypothetical protein